MRHRLHREGRDDRRQGDRPQARHRGPWPGSGKATKAGTATVTVKTSRKLEKLKAAEVTIKVTVTPKGGAK